MKVCPECHDEYRDDIAKCFECDVSLDSMADGRFVPTKKKEVVEELDPANSVAIYAGALEGCKEIQRLVREAKISSLIVPHEGKFAVLIPSDSVDAFKTLMQDQFEDMVNKEQNAQYRPAEVHLDAQEVTCPCCMHKGALADGQCADCGLFLGVEAQ